MIDNKKNLIFSLLVSFFACVNVVFAADLPVIPGAPLINDQSSANDLVLYFYVFFVIVAVALATVKVVMSGLDLLLSESNPARYTKTRNEVIGVLAGITLLVSSVIVINVINPDINKQKNLAFVCEDLDYCVIRKTTEEKDGKKIVKETKEMNVQSEPNNYKKDEFTIKKYFGLQNIITYSDINFGGTPSLIYSDNTSDMKQLTGDVQISAVPSFKIIPKKPGIFLYELPDYKINTLSPLYTKGSINKLADVGYENKVGSINVVNPQEKENIDYMGILFPDDDYRITCKVFYKNVDNVADYFQSKINSLKVYKRDKEYYRDLKIKLTLYNNTSCSEKGGSGEDVDTKQLQKCELTFLGGDAVVPAVAAPLDTAVCDDWSCSLSAPAMDTIISPLVINTACSNLKGEVYSFRVDSPSAILFLDGEDRCDVWDNIRIGRGEGVCNQVNTGGFNPNDNYKPKKVIVVPYNE